MNQLVCCIRSIVAFFSTFIMDYLVGWTTIILLRLSMQGWNSDFPSKNFLLNETAVFVLLILGLYVSIRFKLKK